MVISQLAMKVMAWRMKAAAKCPLAYPGRRQRSRKPLKTSASSAKAAESWPIKRRPAAASCGGNRSMKLYLMQ